MTNQTKCECGDAKDNHGLYGCKVCKPTCLVYRPAQQAEQCEKTRCMTCGQLTRNAAIIGCSDPECGDYCLAAPPEASTPNAAAVEASEREYVDNEGSRLAEIHRDARPDAIVDCARCHENGRLVEWEGKSVVRAARITRCKNKHGVCKTDVYTSPVDAVNAWNEKFGSILAATQPHTEVRETVDKEAMEAKARDFLRARYGENNTHADAGMVRTLASFAVSIAADLEAGTMADKVREYEAALEKIIRLSDEAHHIYKTTGPDSPQYELAMFQYRGIRNAATVARQALSEDKQTEEEK